MLSGVIGWPRICTAPFQPSFSGRMPLRCSSTVDLPEPLGPSSPTHSPGATREAHPAQRLRAVVVTVAQIGDLDGGVHFQPRAHMAS